MDNRQEEHLLSHLKAVWRRRQTLHLTAGVLAFGQWVMPLFLAAVAIDWLTRLPAPVRGVILAILVVVSLYKAWHCGWRHARAFNATHTALQVEEHRGGLESLLVTAVQFGLAGPPRGTSLALCNLTRRRAEEAIANLCAEEVVGFRELRRPVTAVMIFVLIIGAFAVVNGPLLTAGMARILAPWLPVQYPTRTHLELKNGDMVVKEGGSVQIRARVSGVIPSRAEIALRTGTGTSRVHKLPIVAGGCQYAIKSVFRGFEYRLIAGDAQSLRHFVQVIPSPRIERAEVRLEFPSYTDRPAETVDALTLNVPEGTGVQWRLFLDRAVSKADFISAGQKPTPLEISPDGRTVTMRRVASESRGYNFSWVEREHGFSFTSPRYYLQVTPDQPPHVELTSPRRNLYATLGRKLDLTFRGRDDHGIGQSVIAYRTNKTTEQKVSFTAPASGEGRDQRIDWDYRQALPDLAVGDSVSFAVELADRYPGPNGPHRVRSESRRITFLSKEDYLKQVEKQKQRLLLRLRSIYREERAVYDIVRRLDTSDVVFGQTCQLEAVRQDLMRERLNALAGRMGELIEDVAANNISNEAHTAVLDQLRSDIQAIADEQVGGAASSLRAIASVCGNDTSDAPADLTPVVYKINAAARELGCLVLQLGYRDAAEVMARELHATAQTQASVRMRTLMPSEAPSDKAEAVSKAEVRLAKWLSRLLAATPREKESTIQDALIAFNLSRLTRKLKAAGVETEMSQAAVAIQNGKSADAAVLQAKVIQGLLHAEFRLWVGTEYEALSKAREMFVLQANGQKALRVQAAAMTVEEFKKRRAEIERVQTTLRRNNLLLLMPAIPPPRPRLFDTDLPSAPRVNDLLAATEDAMQKAAAHIEAGDRDAAGAQQQKAEQSFEALAEIARIRMEALTRRERTESLLGTCQDSAKQISQFEERQLGLLEKTQDAAADHADCGYLADLQQKLTDDVQKFRATLIVKSKDLSIPADDMSPLLDCIDRAVVSMTEAGSSLKANQPGKAVAHLKSAVGTMEEAAGLLADQVSEVSKYAKVVADTQNAQMPGPYVVDIEGEQNDLIAATRKAKPADLPGLVMPQKNLIHAVNATLTALDFLAHKIESGTVMLFAKSDMDDAAAALEAKDVSEAIDAQRSVADSLHDLRVQVENVAPQYTCILEIIEFLHEVVPKGVNLRVAQSRLRRKILAAPDDASARKLIGEQRELESRAKEYGGLLYKAVGQQRFNDAAEFMTVAISRLDADDRSAAAERMMQAVDVLRTDTIDLLALMERLALVLSPPADPTVEPSPEVKLLLKVLAMAAKQKALYWKTHTAGDQMKSLAAKQRELEKQCAGFVKASKSHPKLVAADKYMTDAAAKMAAASRAGALAGQLQAGQVLRYFIIEYTSKFVEPPLPAGPEPPAPPPDPIYEIEESEISIFMPGVVSGAAPKGGRQEWQVLGRRERAALNENFARELPLEYRSILKDYYERLTR